MKKLFAALILSVGLTPAWAEWYPIARNQGKTFTIFVKLDSIQKNGDIARYWILEENSDSLAIKDGYKSSKSLEETNCKTRMRRTLSDTFYKSSMGQGEVIASGNKAGDWRHIVPESIAESILIFVCNKR
jgi:hypothetical protein